MGLSSEDVEIGFELPPVAKPMTQAKMNAYEACGKRDYRGIHESEEVAKAAGLGQTIASGMMSVMYLHEPMIKFFGEGWAHGGKLRLSFVRPTLPGDTLTVRAVVKEKTPEGDATRVLMDAWLENQRQEKVSVGWASALVGPLEAILQFRGGFADWLMAKPVPQKVAPTRLMTWDVVEVGEELGPYEYVMVQEDLDDFRAAAEDPNALYATIGRKHSSELVEQRYLSGGGVNAGHEVTYYNPPIPGKKLKVFGQVVDKYIRRDKPYVVRAEYCVDEDGHEIESAVHRGMRDPKECGKKWW